ncbi:hypothetical protein Murru_2615 [Allomuricauda ruestringensis DSM 13258]|uniref:Uncharacterized protein n=1 Tax=Allomuricauda ruestringensis (strain DSM 13258 / CIP 107369 / LMG 19739 / B1) TaxID=886377 RepID=G2PQL3_ALLRU|nr:hypothetical protein Murru_2615 [Allomuricauda ruestringensis DSM 13258]
MGTLFLFAGKRAGYRGSKNHISIAFRESVAILQWVQDLIFYQEGVERVYFHEIKPNLGKPLAKCCPIGIY